VTEDVNAVAIVRRNRSIVRVDDEDDGGTGSQIDANLFIDIAAQVPRREYLDDDVRCYPRNIGRRFFFVRHLPKGKEGDIRNEGATFFTGWLNSEFPFGCDFTRSVLSRPGLER